ncbi:hypothetical protein BGZ76_002405, partial [Entomortierella beljakovae]
IDMDHDFLLGTCINPISGNQCPNHVIDPQMVGFKDTNSVRIRVNYYSSSEEYSKSRTVNVRGGINPFGDSGLNMKYDKKTHQNTSYLVYECLVTKYSVYEKEAGSSVSSSEHKKGTSSKFFQAVMNKISMVNKSVTNGMGNQSVAQNKSKPTVECYINNVLYGGYLRVIVEFNMRQTDVQNENFVELEVGLEGILGSIDMYAKFLKKMSDNHQSNEFQYELLLEHSGHANPSQITLYSMADVVKTFISNVQDSNNGRKLVAVGHKHFSPNSGIIQINRKNYIFLKGNYDKIEQSSQPDKLPMLEKMEELLKMLENADIVNQSQFDYHYSRICDQFPHLSYKLINFQFFTYVTKYKKIKEMSIHLLLLKVLDSAKYNSNIQDIAQIKATLNQLETLCSKHEVSDEKFKNQVKKYVDYADEKLKYTTSQIDSDNQSISFNHTYTGINNIEKALQDDNVIYNTFYSRHKIMRFLSNNKYVNTAYELKLSDVVWGTAMVVLTPLILLAPYYLWQGLTDYRMRRLYTTKEFLENINLSYQHNLGLCEHLARNQYENKSEYIEENIANVNNYSVFEKTAKNYQNTKIFSSVSN